MEKYEVPTGHICIIDGDHGKLEFLSIGDYGKEKNIKADFLGLKDEINGVPDGDIMSLSKKWVITISTQYGCSMNCKFCDVPKVGRGVNATVYDLYSQIITGIQLHPEIKFTERLNIHYARMGEPTFNKNVLTNARNLKSELSPYLGNSLIHPVLSTMLPKNNPELSDYLWEWAKIKNLDFNGDAGLQFSINSTSDKQRNHMFSGGACSLSEVSRLGKRLPIPQGRKYTLNFALADYYKVDARKLADLFDTRYFIVKITPLHVTTACRKNNIKTTGGYDEYTPYQKAEDDLKKAGFDVLVFIPSKEEDESRITCGNAILADIKRRNDEV